MEDYQTKLKDARDMLAIAIECEPTQLAISLLEPDISKGA